MTHGRSRLSVCGVTLKETHRPGPFGPRLSGLWLFFPPAIAVVQVVGAHVAGLRQPGRTDLDALGILLLAAGPAALFLRGRYPVAVLWFVLAATVGYLLLDYPRGPIFFGLIVAFFGAVMSGHRVAATASLAIGYPTFLWLPSLVGPDPPPSPAQVLALAAWLLVLLAGAEIARTRRERAIERVQARAEEARHRASEERMRIARELHDVLAHNISLINVQAGVALHLIDERPEQARSALAAIKQASNEALGELRSVLDILREGHESPPRAPTSGLARLDDLISKTEAAGLQVKTQVAGTPRPLSPKLDLAAFRIVQEALTNVRRHAGDALATVRINYGERDLTVEVDDDGIGAEPPTFGGGKGIAGMRERVTALDGDLEAGPRPGGGFRVHARLPLRDDESEESP